MPPLTFPPPTEGECARAVFAEVSEHQRVTEQKHLQISVMYMGFVALALSILAPTSDAGGNQAIFHTWSRSIAYAALVAIGCTTMYVQAEYRGWKKHYQAICFLLASNWPLDEALKPWWLLHHPYESSPDRAHRFPLSGENVLTYFTFVTTSGTLALLLISMRHQISPNWASWLSVGLAGAAYGLFVGYLRLRVHKKQRAVLAHVKSYVLSAEDHDGAPE